MKLVHNKQPLPKHLQEYVDRAKEINRRAYIHNCMGGHIGFFKKEMKQLGEEIALLKRAEGES